MDKLSFRSAACLAVVAAAQYSWRFMPVEGLQSDDTGSKAPARSGLDATLATRRFARVRAKPV